MNNIFISIIFIAYYIICSLFCYNFITDSIIITLIYPILLPIAIIVAIGFIFFFIMLVGAGLQYINGFFLSKDVYLSIKPLLGIIYFILIYMGFTLITDGLFYENSTVICPSHTDYYHWDLECYYLPEDFYPTDEEETMISNALISGKIPCKNCVDYYSDLVSRKYSLISFIVFFLIFVLIEYLYKNDLIPQSILNIIAKAISKFNH